MERKIFISYSRRDTTLVDKIVSELKSLDYDVWLDREEIHGGQIWWNEICLSIESKDIFIAIISPNYLASVACKYERDYALKLQKAILPIIIDAKALQLLPPDFKQFQYVDGVKHDRKALLDLISAVTNLSIKPQNSYKYDIALRPPVPPDRDETIIKRLEQSKRGELTFQEQRSLFNEIKGGLIDRETRVKSLERLEAFSNHELARNLHDEIKDLLDVEKTKKLASPKILEIQEELQRLSEINPNRQAEIVKTLKDAFTNPKDKEDAIPLLKQINNSDYVPQKLANEVKLLLGLAYADAADNTLRERPRGMGNDASKSPAAIFVPNWGLVINNIFIASIWAYIFFGVYDSLARTFTTKDYPVNLLLLIGILVPWIVQGIVSGRIISKEPKNLLWYLRAGVFGGVLSVFQVVDRQRSLKTTQYVLWFLVLALIIGVSVAFGMELYAKLLYWNRRYSDEYYYRILYQSIAGLSTGALLGFGLGYVLSIFDKLTKRQMQKINLPVIS